MEMSQGSGIASLLLDGDRFIVSVQGYTYCLDPSSGDVMWQNALKGMRSWRPLPGLGARQHDVSIVCRLRRYEQQQQRRPPVSRNLVAASAAAQTIPPSNHLRGISMAHKLVLTIVVTAATTLLVQAGQRRRQRSASRLRGALTGGI